MLYECYIKNRKTLIFVFVGKGRLYKPKILLFHSIIYNQNIGTLSNDEKYIYIWSACLRKFFRHAFIPPQIILLKIILLRQVSLPLSNICFR